MITLKQAFSRAGELNLPTLDKLAQFKTGLHEIRTAKAKKITNKRRTVKESRRQNRKKG